MDGLDEPMDTEVRDVEPLYRRATPDDVIACNELMWTSVAVPVRIAGLCRDQPSTLPFLPPARENLHRR